MSNSIVAIIQGRMGSSRLPGKVLLDIAGKPMLQHVIERTQRAQNITSVVVATSCDPLDDPIAAFCAHTGVSCARGSLHDVLDRFYQAANAHKADVVVRITADCPVIDPELIDRTINLVTKCLSSKSIDFAANRLPPPFRRTFPIGLDVEVSSFSALERAWQESTETFHREHVMPYLYEGVTLEADGLLSSGRSPRGFNIALLNHDPDLGALRWTVDTPEDLIFIREIFSRLNGKADFNWYDVLNILEGEPELARINSEVRHKSMTEIDHRAHNSSQQSPL